jgi:hypothetical protein
VELQRPRVRVGGRRGKHPLPDGKARGDLVGQMGRQVGFLRLGEEGLQVRKDWTRAIATCTISPSCARWRILERSREDHPGGEMEPAIRQPNPSLRYGDFPELFWDAQPDAVIDVQSPVTLARLLTSG